MQLGGYGERRIDQLSGRPAPTRGALARAIVFEPRILLMDEPLSALDKKLREHMQIELRHLHEQLGMTTVYVTHDQREALTMSDRIAVINHGRVMQLDTPSRIYEQPANRFVADFIGESTFLAVTREGDRVLCAGKPLATAAKPPAGALALMLRPERLRLLAPDAAQDPAVNRFEAVVEDVVYQGDSHMILARLPDGTEIGIRAAAHRDAVARMPSEGETVALGLHAEDTVLIQDVGAAT